MVEYLQSKNGYFYKLKKKWRKKKNIARRI